MSSVKQVLRNMCYVMYGHKPNEKPPMANEISIQLANEFQKASEKLIAKKFINRIKKASRKNGIPRKFRLYVMWIIFQKQRNWPVDIRTKEGQALRIAAMLADDREPEYGKLKVPPANLEEAVDQAIKEVAHWALHDMQAALLKLFLALLDKHARCVQEFYEGQLDEDQAWSYLKEMFTHSLTKFPAWFREAKAVRRIVLNLFPSF